MNRIMGRPWPFQKDAQLGRRWVWICLGILLVGLSGALFLNLWIHPERYQRDLQAYYFAGKAFQAGANPYDLGVLTRLAGAQLSNGFVYPPITLPVFRLLAQLPYPAVYRGFLLVKVALLAGLVGLWLRTFVKHQPWVFLPFAAVAFNAAIYVDLRVGNISIFEQILIWIGLYCLLKRWPILFIGSILAASLFKITPILFLGLLLLTEHRRRYRHLLLGLGIFAGIHFITYLSSPDLFQGFVDASARLTERGVVNPSTAELIKDAFAAASRTSAGTVPAIVPGLVYLLAAAAVALVTLIAIARLNAAKLNQRTLLQIYLACLAYGLAIPRFKTYSYVLVLVPAYWVLMEAGRRLHSRNNAHPLLAVTPLLLVTGLSSAYAAAYGPTLVEGSVLGYAPWAAMFMIWVAFLTGIGLRRKGWLLAPDQQELPASSIPDKSDPSLPPQIYTQDYYLQVCGGYREFLDGGVASRLEEAIRLGGLEPGMAVLDIGSGRGEMALRCAELGCRVWGIDYSADALTLSRDLLRRRGRMEREGRVLFQKMNSKALAFPDGFFDRVFLIDVVEHLYPRELQTTLEEVGRVTKAGGRVVVHTAPNRWLIKPIYLLAGLLFQWKRHPYHVYEQSYVTLTRNLRHLGGEVRVQMSKVPGFFELGVGPQASEGSRFARIAQALDLMFDARPTVALIVHTPLRYALATDLWATVDLPPSHSWERSAIA